MKIKFNFFNFLISFFIYLRLISSFSTVGVSSRSMWRHRHGRSPLDGSFHPSQSVWGFRSDRKFWSKTVEGFLVRSCLPYKLQYSQDETTRRIGVSKLKQKYLSSRNFYSRLTFTSSIAGVSSRVVKRPFIISKAN